MAVYAVLQNELQNLGRLLSLVSIRVDSRLNSFVYHCFRKPGR